MKCLRRTTGAAEGTTINEHSLTIHSERRRGQRPGHQDHVPATHNVRRRGQRPGATFKYLRCTTSGAAGDGLGITIKYLRATAFIGLGHTIKYLRSVLERPRLRSRSRKPESTPRVFCTNHNPP
jgi:hypothetical protein